ncbi:MAG: PilZ domain-containing protein [Thermoanaerobaculia bacterium]
MGRYIQKVSIGSRETWVGWILDGIEGEIDGLTPADEMSEEELALKGVREFHQAPRAMLGQVEKRRRRRIRLSAPLQANVNSRTAEVWDLSSSGVGIQHQFKLKPATEITVEIQGPEGRRSLRFEVLRCELSRSLKATGEILYYSALRLADGAMDAGEFLRRLMDRNADNAFGLPDGAARSRHAFL